MNEMIVNQFNDIINKFIPEECLIIGDINVDLNKKEESFWSSNMKDMGFVQLIQKNTRFESLIDHFYTNRPNNISGSGVLSSTFSDHLPIFAARKHRIGDRIGSKSKSIMYYRNWKTIDKNKIETMISSIDLNNDINKITNDLNFKIRDIMKTEIPLKKKLVKVSIKDNWISTEVLLLMKTRNIAKLKLISAIKKRFPVEVIENLRTKYKDLRNRTRYAVNKCKKTYINNKLLDCKGSRDMWKVLKTILPNKRKATKPLPLSADTLNNSFIDDRDLLLQKAFNGNDDIELDFRLKTTNVFEIPELTEDNVKQIVSNMSSDKATGSDGLSARFTKLFLSALMPILLVIFNCSIRNGIFPFSWKISKVTALFKKGVQTDPQNYRPISVVPFLSKVLEKHVFDHFYTFLTENQLLSVNQFGFRKRCSVIDALLSLKLNIISALNQNKKCIVISLDLKKAFDLVSHELLLNKLFKYGCNEITLKWFKSYLQNRNQFVKTANNVSDIRSVGSVSVPQGSIGGPLLFLLFINDLTELPLNGKITLFADDTTLTLTGNTFDEVVMKTNQDLELIHNWLTKNKLLLNLDKSNYMVMGRPRNDLTLNIKVGSHSLQRVFQTTILGVVWNSNLNFEYHLSKTCQIITKRISFLSRIRYFFPKKTVSLIYNAIVLPYFDFADVIWGHTYEKHLKRLSRLQSRAAKVILNEKYSYSSMDAIKRLNWLSFHSRIKYHSVIYIYKSLHNMVSNISETFFSYSLTRSSNRLGDDHILALINPKKKFYINSLFYKGIQLYNDLNIDIRRCTSLITFKRLAFDYFNL